MRVFRPLVFRSERIRLEPLSFAMHGEGLCDISSNNRIWDNMGTAGFRMCNKEGNVPITEAWFKEAAIAEVWLPFVSTQRRSYTNTAHLTQKAKSEIPFAIRRLVDSKLLGSTRYILKYPCGTAS